MGGLCLSAHRRRPTSDVTDSDGRSAPCGPPDPGAPVAAHDGAAVPVQAGPHDELDSLRRENSALRNRLATLGQASLQINQDADLDLILQNVVDSARSLTGASYGTVVIFDSLQDLSGIVTSGIEQSGMEHWVDRMPEVMALLEFLNRIDEPMMVNDFPEFAGPFQLPDILPPIQSFMAAPIRNRQVHLGNIYLSIDAGGHQFTLEDQEMLAMFADQAAIAISNIRRYHDESQSRAGLQALIDTAPVAVLVFDAKTRDLISFNLETRRIVRGLHAPGHGLPQLLEVMKFRRSDGRDIPPEELPTERAIRSGETVRAEDVVIHLPDGPPVPTLCNATPIRSENGEIVSVVATLQDMTPLEDLERQRAEFLGMVSHELRMPLASIKGSAAALLGASSPLSPSEAEQFYRIIDQQSDHLLDIIKNLLDLTRVEAGVLSVDARPAAVVDLVEEARRAFVSGGYRNSLEVELPPNLPSVMADRNRIIQVLGNLLSNASNHSPTQSVIRIGASLEVPYVAVTVSDEGAGISEDQLPHLFRKFSRISREDGGWRTEGEGLGLAICKGVVETHGGRIRAESPGLGLGARFTFTMPVAYEEATPAAQDTSMPATERQGGRILAVDDDQQMLWLLRRIFADAGYTPISTNKPEEVERLIEAERPRLIVLDRMLPGTDGFELMKRISDITDAPVIFLSGRGRDQDVVRAFELGAADYVVKPFSSLELMARIRAALENQTSDLQRHREPYMLGDLEIDYTERRVAVAGHPAHLSATEYKLLFELSIDAGRVLTHDQLLRRVWGLEHSGDPRLVRTSVKAIRRKLGDDARSPTYIFTEPRVGYRMAKP